MRRLGFLGLSFLGLIVIGGCFTSPAPAGPAQPPREPVDRRDAGPAPPPPPAGEHALVFTEGIARAFRKCDAQAPPLVWIETQTGTAPVFAIAIELRHGPGDPVPRAIAVGGSSPSRCDPGCTGTVWLDAVVPGKRVRGRLDLTWADGRAARQRFDYAWRGGRWEVSPCPGMPDTHP